MSHMGEQRGGLLDFLGVSLPDSHGAPRGNHHQPQPQSHPQPPSPHSSAPPSVASEHSEASFRGPPLEERGSDYHQDRLPAGTRPHRAGATPGRHDPPHYEAEENRYHLMTSSNGYSPPAGAGARSEGRVGKGRGGFQPPSAPAVSAVPRLFDEGDLERTRSPCKRGVGGTNHSGRMPPHIAMPGYEESSRPGRGQGYYSHLSRQTPPTDQADWLLGGRNRPTGGTANSRGPAMAAEEHQDCCGRSDRAFRYPL